MRVALCSHVKYGCWDGGRDECAAAVWVPSWLRFMVG
jgi:hypothetical protein